MERVYLNGEILPWDEAAGSPLDRGFLYGDGLFETTRVMAGVPLLLDMHLARLAGSCRSLGFVYTPDMDVISESVRRLIEANGVREGYLRITVTRGVHEGALTDLEAPEPTVLIQARSMSLPPLEQHPPIVLGRAPFPINEGSPIAAHKSTSYQPNLLALAEGRADGADEVYFLNSRGHLAEGAISNLFLIRDGVVHTPEVGCGLLPGITRRVVLGLCRESDIPCEQGMYPESDILRADEVFCTNSLRGIMPVGVLKGCDERHLAAPGPLTRRLQQAYARYARDAGGR